MRKSAAALFAAFLLTGCGIQTLETSQDSSAPDSSVQTAAPPSADSGKETTAAVQTAPEPVTGTQEINADSSSAPETDVSTKPVNLQSEQNPEPAVTTQEINADSSSAPEPPAAGHIIQNVPHLDQSTGYATACESLAALSFMEFFGYHVDPGTFIRQYLPTAPYPAADEKGYLHGESPWSYFIGDPLKSNGYGCYSPVIVQAIRNAKFPGEIEGLCDVPLETLCSDYIDKDRPVIIWGTIGMQPTRKGHSWYLPDGTYFTYIRPEHALVLIGYDDSKYYFSDSLSPDTVTPYAKKDVETAYLAMHRQAIALKS